MTCGGLCPGLNDVVQNIVFTLADYGEGSDPIRQLSGSCWTHKAAAPHSPSTPPPKKGVPEDQILGIRYGLRGFYDRDAKPVTLTRRAVDGIHLKGGTVLVRVGRGVGQTSLLA